MGEAPSTRPEPSKAAFVAHSRSRSAVHLSAVPGCKRYSGRSKAVSSDRVLPDLAVMALSGSTSIVPSRNSRSFPFAH